MNEVHNRDWCFVNVCTGPCRSTCMSDLFRFLPLDFSDSQNPVDSDHDTCKRRDATTYMSTTATAPRDIDICTSKSLSSRCTSVSTAEVFTVHPAREESSVALCAPPTSVENATR